MRIEPSDIKDAKLFKYYRLVRKWAAKSYGLTEADLELIIYLECEGHFTRQDFMDGQFAYSWDKNRWLRLRKEGWIDIWRERNRSTMKYNIYSVSLKAKIMTNRIFKILLGQEDLPRSERNVFYKGKNYTDKVYSKAVDLMLKDESR